MGTVAKRGTSYRAMIRKVGHEPMYETFKTHKEAKDWVRDTEKEIEEKTITNPRIKIMDLVDKYVAEVAPKRKMADSHLKHDIPSIKRAFSDMRMSDLQGRGLMEWVLKRNDVAPSTTNWHIARLFGVLRQAESHWGIAIPWKDMKTCRDRLWELGYLALANERDRRVTDEELTLIKSKLSPNTLQPIADTLDFCLASAMRISEVVRITWSDFDEKNRTVIVRDRKHPRKKFGNHQTVPLLNGAFEIAARQPRVNERIFPRCKNYMSRVFHETSVKAGVPDVVLHDLRHEGISRLFELGFAIQEVCLVSGHTNWKTLARYTHLKPTSLVEKEKRLRELAA